jgi:hypothetical protein
MKKTRLSPRILLSRSASPQGQPDRSLARSAWDSAPTPKKNRPVGYGMMGPCLSITSLSKRASVHSATPELLQLLNSVPLHVQSPSA